MRLLGGCFCGELRYEAGGAPFNELLCHCTICRRTTGAPMVAWFSAPRERFRWVRGQPAQFRSTPVAVRSFCPRCGTQLTFAHDEFPDEVDVTTASLDDPHAVPPRAHIFARSRLQWVRLDDGLPRFPTDHE